jgi:thymidylate synthase (FAD)
MNILLSAVTQPLIRTADNVRNLTIDEFIVYCARVSNPNNQLNVLSAPNLIKYCIDHEHWSIFEQASLTFEIQTSRDISAQIIRHKSFSFQEFSQRYSKVTSLEDFNIRKQAEKNRQSSTENIEMSEEENLEIKNHLLNSLYLYNKWIDRGAAKESMRKILPLCTQTTLYMTGNVRSWIHYIKVRATPETQEEHRVIAENIKEILIQVIPTIAEALEWNKNELPVD